MFLVPTACRLAATASHMNNTTTHSTYIVCWSSRSKRPNSLPVTPLEWPVWKATCVTTTPMAAHARIPSTAGRKLRTPPVTTSSLTEDQVAARTQRLQCVFGSEFWRTTIVAEDASARAVSAVPTYGVSDGWLQLTEMKKPRAESFFKYVRAERGLPMPRR